jgi:cytochrome bd-type quinol oxidase subunit 2
MEGTDGIIIGVGLLALLFTIIYAVLALIFFNLKMDDKLAARGYSKLQYRMLIFVITILVVLLIVFYFSR